MTLHPLATVRFVVEKADHLAEVRNRTFPISLQESLFPLKDSSELNSIVIKCFELLSCFSRVI